MVRCRSYLQLLWCATLVSAQASTYVLLPKESYTVTMKDRPTPADDEVVVQTDNGDVNIFPGKALIKRANDECGDNRDLNCYNAFANALGHAADGAESGISKRMIKLVKGSWIVEGVMILFAMWYLRAADSDGMRLSADEISKITKSAEATNIYMTATDDKNPLTVAVTAAPTPTGDEGPVVTHKADGSMEITNLKNEVDSAKKIMSNVNCKRAELMLSKRQMSDALRDCINLAAESLTQNTNLGGPLQNWQKARVVEEGGGGDSIAGIPLPLGWNSIPEALAQIADLLNLSRTIVGTGNEAQALNNAGAVRSAVSRLSLLISWAYLGKGIDLKDRMDILAENWEPEPTEEKICPDGATVPFGCDDDCGGKDENGPKKDGRLFTCKGRTDIDTRKGYVAI